ncbi:MAG TPA: ElyC/SanA/YdcF family protein [Labilithrix sp.]|nr:ElyC/SanA/YdcF family protein [Labilithrix sp.]
MSPLARIGALLAFLGGGIAALGCGYREAVPSFREHDARFGRLGGGSAAAPTKSAMCRSWSQTILARDSWASAHVSFPETNVQDACFTPVRHEGREVRVGAAPAGCAYPEDAGRARLVALAEELERLAAAGAGSHPLFPCSLRAADLSAAARQNARVLRALAARPERYPYAAVILPGHGQREQDGTALADYLPGDACRPLGGGDLERLGAMPVRTAIGGDAMRGDVAPVVIASGGAVHSSLVEAFAMMHLLQCRERIAADRILVEPCAEHTHTNLRNSGRWVDALGGRAAYLLTDTGIQAEYFQDWTGFELVLGSVDQRSIRDWGYLLGSWRQASVGTSSGFWFTPYRFWAEPRQGLGSVTCVDM